MKKILILGAGTAGTIMANKLRKALNATEWDITLVDREETHYYQPGFLFIPFGSYTKKDVVKPIDKYLPTGITLIKKEIVKVEAESNQVLLADDTKLAYDILIVASGSQIKPDETAGMKDSLWQKKIFDFYTLEGAMALHDFFKTWEGGKLVMAITEMPFKCPVAPLEFVCLADAFFTKRGIRDKVEISLVTPLPGAFTKPIATQMLSQVLKDKNINIIPDFYIEHIDNDACKLVSYDEKEVPFDVLAIVPLNKGADFIGASGLGDDLNFVPVNKQTLQHGEFKNIFVIGDAAAVPASKAGSVVHFEAETVFENILSVIQNKEVEAKFDGHANCYVETGFGKAALIDFNYDTEPLPGTYPVPGVGPFKLLKTTWINHLGKLFFRWLYWNILLKARPLPVSHHMSMAGKKRITL
jgi:NADH dehydrogenase, FAD-containing subunit